MCLKYFIQQIPHFHYFYRYSCDQCNTSFDEMSDLIDHMNATHGPAEQETVIEECSSQGMYDTGEA